MRNTILSLGLASALMMAGCQSHEPAETSAQTQTRGLGQDTADVDLADDDRAMDTTEDKDPDLDLDSGTINNTRIDFNGDGVPDEGTVTSPDEDVSGGRVKYIDKEELEKLEPAQAAPPAATAPDLK